MSIPSMVWIVTYRVDSTSPQQELKRYTEEAAKHFAQGIIDAGGVAIVVEDIEEAPREDNNGDSPYVSERRKLQW